MSLPVAAPRNCTVVGMPQRLGRLGHVLRGLDAPDGDAPGQEVLKKVPVVARHFGDEAVRRETEAVDHESANRLAWATQESEYDEKYA